MKIKAIINITSTKRDTNGNVYSRATVTNTRNGKTTAGFKASSAGNVSSVIRQLLDVGFSSISAAEETTGSTRIASLPDGEYMRVPVFAKELRKVGFSAPVVRVKACRGCM